MSIQTSNSNHFRESLEISLFRVQKMIKFRIYYTYKLTQKKVKVINQIFNPLANLGKYFIKAQHTLFQFSIEYKSSLLGLKY